MKFIFPKNYTFKAKLLGFIDYTTAIFNAILILIIYFLTNVIFSDINFKIYFFIAVYFPIFLFSVLCFQTENIISVIYYTIYFFKNRNIYLYKKTHIDIKNKDS